MGHRDGQVHRREVVRRLRGVVRPGRRGPRPTRPPGRRHRPPEGIPRVTGSPRMVTSGERLRRLLALVPYVVSRKSVSLAETAATFGVTQRELIDDLNLAWCVELNGPQPYCPIDLSYEGGEIVVSQAEAIDRPLRLAADEASALLVALRMLGDVGGGDTAVVNSVIEKLIAAAGGAEVTSAQVVVVNPIGDQQWAGPLQSALADGRRVRLRYYVPGRD